MFSRAHPKTRATATKVEVSPRRGEPALVNPAWLRLAWASPPTRSGAMAFPHGAELSRALGMRQPPRAVLDREACEARGQPAFTDGQTTHFAAPTVPLHVAAHEAVHQMQHAGEVHDAGLGAEGHANRVADAVVAARDPSPLLGRGGARVPSATRGYFTTDAAGNLATGGAAVGKLSETHETWTRGNQGKDKEAYATPDQFKRANSILRAIDSAISLRKNGKTMQVAHPVEPGKTWTLHGIDARFGNGPWDDCGRMARDLMGPSGADSPAQAVVRPGGQQVVLPGVQYGKRSPEEQLALTIAMDRAMNKAGGSAAKRRAAAEKVLREYNSKWSKQSWVRQQSKSSLSSADAERMGLDTHVVPDVGEAYSTVKENKYHWAGVIMDPGDDRVVLEATADGDYDKKASDWAIDTYGTKKASQTFHEAQMRTSTYSGGHTLHMRQGILSPVYAPQKIRLDVEVHSVRDKPSGKDTVVIGFFGGKYQSLRTKDLAPGQSQTLEMPMSKLWPLRSPLRLEIGELSLTTFKLGDIHWPPPMGMKTATIDAHGAKYTISLAIT